MMSIPLPLRWDCMLVMCMFVRSSGFLWFMICWVFARSLAFQMKRVALHIDMVSTFLCI